VGTLRLVRHGQASFGAANYDVLSPTGIAQAEALGRSWSAARTQVDAIYSGPMQRQRDTARLASAASALAGQVVPDPIVIDGWAEYPAFELYARFLPRIIAEQPALRGLHGSQTDGPIDPTLLDRAFTHVIAAWTDGTIDTGGIETFAQFVARIDAAVADVLARHPGRGQRVIVVTSGGPIGVVAKLALGLTPPTTVEMWRLVRNASVTDVLWRRRDQRSELSLLGWNHVDHLTADLHTFR
jgi:broad specificity phosphatase PhoE